MWDLWLFYVIIGAGIIGLILGLVGSRSRTRKLSRFARRIGFHFIPKHAIGKDPTLSRMRALRKGIGRRCANLIGGIHRDVELVAIDVSRPVVLGATIREEDEHGSECVTVCVHPLGCDFPDLYIRSDKLLDTDPLAVFRADDHRDIQFESEEFNETFRVSCDDRKFAFDFCHSRMMAYLLSHREWVVLISNGVLLIHDAMLWEIGDYSRAFNVMADVVELIPGFLKQAGGRNATLPATEGN